MRCLDLDPYETVGIGASTVDFLDVFLLHCLLAPSPPDTTQEIAALRRNQQHTAARGREPGLRLERDDGEVALQDWGAQILAECEPLARALDAANRSERHTQALQAASAAWHSPQRLPSARLLAEMSERYRGSYIALVRDKSRLTHQQLLQQPLNDGERAAFETASRVSFDAQRRIEASDTLSFEAYREQYLSPQGLVI